MRSLVLVCCLLLACCGSANAGSCRVKHSGLVVTAIAVPVGVPVAPLASVVYGYAAGTGSTPGPQTTAGPGCACRCSCQAPQPGPVGHCPTPTPDNPPGVEPIAESVSDGDRIMRERCATCHTAGAGKSELILFDGAQWADGWRQHRRAIFNAVKTGEMPKNGPPLTDDEFGAVVEWLLSD